MDIKIDDKPEQRPRPRRKKKRTLEIIVICYLLLSSLILVVVKRQYLHCAYLKFVKGENVGILDGKIVNLDELPRKRKIIFVNQPQDDTAAKAARAAEARYYDDLNKRRLAELETNLKKLEAQERRQAERQKAHEAGQQIKCWMDETGRKYYTNTAPTGEKALTLCP